VELFATLDIFGCEPDSKSLIPHLAVKTLREILVLGAVTDEARVELNRLQRADQGTLLHNQSIRHATSAEECLRDLTLGTEERIDTNCARTFVEELSEALCSREIDIGKNRPQACRAAQIRAAEISTAKICLAEVGIYEFGTSKDGTAEIGRAEIGTVEVGSIEIGSTEARDFLAFRSTSIPVANAQNPSPEQSKCLVAIHVGGPYNEFFDDQSSPSESTRDDLTDLPPWRMQPMSRKWLPLSLTLLCFVAIPSATFAWNSTGHRVIASIAYRQLDEPTKRRIGEMLRKHPAYVELWSNRETNGPDEVQNLFWNASVFPDDTRRSPWDKFSRPKAHYVNYRILADQGNKLEPPARGENILNSYVAHLKQIQDSRTPIETKALHLSWILHQAGDIHQPLHVVARFSKALPEGDRGGNGVTFPNPRAGGGRESNLHAYWDDLLGTDSSPSAVDRLAEEIAKEFPAANFAKELGNRNIRDWAEESVEICLKTVYKNLDPDISQFFDLPIGYEADAQRVARRRVALAGYRLAEELKRLFADK